MPPEKASIIGKSLWKTRFVSLGPAPPAAAPSMRSNGPRSTSSSSSSSRLNSSLKQLKLGSRNASQISVEQAYPANDRWLCVYKHKGDHEPVALYAASSIVSCTVQDYTHRKTHSAQPTLIVTVQAGGPKKKNRQARRLSQTGGLSASHTATILFRAVQSAPDSIRGWQEALQDLLDAPPDQHRADAALPYSSNRPSTSTARPTLPPSQESYVSAGGSHPGSALSIRTSHTALSSPISSSPQNAAHGLESSSSPRSDRFGSPSPYRTVSPPFPPPPPPAAVVRETILDRAFKMNCIPGAAPALEGEPAMNSIARFEALMQDIEARRAAADARPAGVDGRAHDSDEKDVIPAAAQRALEYIASGQRTSCSTIDSAGGGGGRSPGGAASSSTTSSVRPSRRPRPASLALPSNSLRSPILDGQPTDRRRSSVSTTPSSLATSSMMSHPTTILTTNHQNTNGNSNNNNNPHQHHHHHHHHPPHHHRTMSTTNPPTTAAATTTTSTSSKRLSLADFTRRFSSSSSVIMARTTTTTSSRSSGISDVSFHCVGEDDSSWGDMLVVAGGDGGGGMPRRTTMSTSTPSTRGGGGGGGGGTAGGSRITGNVSSHHHHRHHHRLSGSAIGV